MWKVLLVVAISVGLVVFVNREMRRMLLSSHVRFFFLIVLVVTLLSGMAGGGYAAWKYWWPVYMARPTMEWTDITIEEDLSPPTPQTGRRTRPPSGFRWIRSLVAVPRVLAQQATPESTDYRVRPDVIDAGGLDVTKSSNYLLSDSLGEPIVGHAESTDYLLESGYRKPAAAEFLSMTCSATAVLGSVAGSGQKTGSGTCIVYSDASNGYNLGWAVLSGSGGVNTGSLISQYNDTIGPFTPAVLNTSETWSVASTDAEWGARLRSSSTDAASEWGTDASSEKWLNVRSSNRTIVTRGSGTPIAGSTEIVQFRAEVGSSKFQQTGLYQATVTFTVVGY